MKLTVDVDAPGATSDDFRVERHDANSATGRRLLASVARIGTWPNKGNMAPGGTQSATMGKLPHTPEHAHTYTEATSVTIRIPHDGDSTTNTQIISLHGRATDGDSFTATNNDPYTPIFHDPYSGAAGSSTDDGPQAKAGEYLEPGRTTFSAGSGQTDRAKRGQRDPIKLSWACTGNGLASATNSLAIDAQSSKGHAQGYRASTGQRTSGNSIYESDERTSCTSVPDISGNKPACLVHSLDQPPPTGWGAHALQDGPDITLTVQGAPFAQGGSTTKTVSCVMTSKDPYGATGTHTVTITVQPEQNVAPVANWVSGAATTYTVPHDHSPETNTVQVLLAGTYTDADNGNNNVGPLGNTAIETTQSAQRRGLGVQEQLSWEGTYKENDASAWALFRGRPAKTHETDGDANTKGHSTPNEASLTYGQDSHTASWVCGGVTYPGLRPVVTLEGPKWTMHSSGTWAAGGGQVGRATSQTQWAATHKDTSCTLTVTDSYGQAHTKTQVIRVNREPNAAPTQDLSKTVLSWTIPHDYDPSTNTVLVKLEGKDSPDADNDKVKHKWVCGSAATATVELPFPVQLGGFNSGVTKHSSGGIQSGSRDPQYKILTTAESAVQTSIGWGTDMGPSGDGDTFSGTHSHHKNVAYVSLPAGTHACACTTTDTYNEMTTASVNVVVNAEPNNAPSRL
jgi:hypothetical protein